MLNKLRHLLPPSSLLTVILVAIFIVLVNYKPGAYLSGWDTLHPEFNLSLYTERVFFGAWQEHQGLGAPASQAHAAELTRLPLLFLLDLILPSSAVRYAFFSLMYVMGGVGMYQFIRRCWFEHRIGSQFDWAATLGALLFLLNLGTLQHFYVPLEMFAVHFASIGFVLCTLYQAVKYPSPQKYAAFFLVQLLATSVAHTATLFYMYVAVLFVYAALLSLGTWRKKITIIKQLVILGCLILIANLFWIAPNLYYVFHHSEYVTDAKITRQFSTEAFWQNQAFGKLSDILILKNFLFNWMDYDFTSQSFNPLFSSWERLLRPFGYIVLGIIAILTLFGMAFSFGGKHRAHSTAIAISLFLIPVFFLNNFNFPFSSLYHLIQSFSDTLSEALRFPFTKFSILLMAAMSIYFAHFASVMLHHATKIAASVNKHHAFISSIVLLFLLIFLSTLPAFTGNLINPQMKVSYPNEYRQLFDWFESQPRQSRIAKFPLISHFGWTYHLWPQGSLNQGYQGAGFIWFGLPQPILDREFDRWAAPNEFFNYELASAVAATDPISLMQVLQKYHVDWLLFDTSTINPHTQFKKNYQQEFEVLIAETAGISQAQEFGFLKIYSVETDDSSSWIGSSTTTAMTNNVERVKDDVIYEKEGNYITTPDAAVSYPFAELKKETTQKYTFTSDALSTSAVTSIGGDLTLPKWTDANNSIPVEVYTQLSGPTTLEVVIHSLLPTISLDNQSIDLQDYASNRTIQYQIQLPDATETYIMRLNNSYVIFKPTTDPQYFGAFSFPLDAVAIELYASTPERIYSLIEGYTYSAHNCFTEQSNEDIVANVTDDALFMFAYRQTACATKLQSHTIPDKGLLSLEYSYRSTTPNTFTQVCLFRRGRDGCINQNKYYIDIASEQLKSLQVYEPIETSDQVNVSFDLSAETDGRNIEYSDAYLSYHPHIQTVEVTTDSLLSLTPRKINLSAQPNATLTLEQQFGSENELLFQRDLSRLSTSQNCANEGEVSVENEGNSHILTAVNKGIVCGHYRFDSIIPVQEYIASVTTKNIQGKELLINILASEKVLIDEVFAEGTLTHNFWIDDRRISDDLQISLSGHSYSSYSSINQVLDISVAPFPVTYASQLRIESVEGRKTYPAAEIVSSLRRANFWYTTEVNAVEPSVIYLSQTYDTGWLAFKGFSVLPHHLYNSWANAWIVPEGTHNITIFYLPQLLQFGGLAILVSFSLYGWIRFRFHIADFFRTHSSPSKKYPLLKTKLLGKFMGE